MSTHQRLLTTSETLAFLGISRSMLHKLVASGSIPIVKIGRSSRFDQEDLKTYIAEQKRGPTKG